VKRQFDGHKMDLHKIRRDNFINLPMMLWRTGLWETVGGFDEDAGPATDWDWTLRCIQAGAQYHFVDEVLVTHHWGTDNWCLREDGKPYIMQKMARGSYD
jgi:GT2 family glycosyltransferase